MRLELVRSTKRRAISLTPLIDVVFILLLFFMITTTFQRQQAMTVNVPGPARASTPAATLESLLITLTADSTLTLGGQTGITQQELAEHVLMADALASDMPIRIKPDDDVELQTLTRLMDHLSTLGLSSVSLSGLR